MYQKNFIIITEEGLHARPVTQLINIANKYEAEIKIQYNRRTVNLKSILAVMGLSIKEGEEIIIISEGKDSGAALLDIENSIKNEKIGVEITTTSAPQ